MEQRVRVVGRSVASCEGAALSVATLFDEGRLQLPPEIGFLFRSGASAATLLQAMIEAAKCGVSCDEALIAEGLIEEEAFYRLLAHRVGATFLNEGIVVCGDIDAPLVVRTGLAPLAANSTGLRVVMAPRGRKLAKLLREVDSGKALEGLAICSPRRFNEAVRQAAAPRLATAAARGLAAKDSSLSAHRRLSRGQRVLVALLALAALVFVARGPGWLSCTGWISLFAIFATAAVTRLIVAVAPCRRLAAAALAENETPIYSIIVALRREANMVDRLLDGLDELDYPRSKLDIKIVIEPDDDETAAALNDRGERLPRFEVIVAPKGEPRTKPRALNIALPFARGEFLVVYDAEDRPQRNQLRLAASHFKAEPAIDCLQARLTIDNADASWVSRLFAIEYCALFDVINPGLAALGAPIALGGTSNHFRTAVLRRVGGWDAWNVAEDADLGLRLARYGRRVATFASDTAEEAPVALGQWLRQRRRWKKGWLQTAIVHARHPRRVVRELGWRGAAFAFSHIGGAVLGGLLGPALTLSALYRLATGVWPTPSTSASNLAAVASFLLLVWGCAALLTPPFLALQARGHRDWLWAIGLLPLYYCLISFAAWWAVLDLVVAPHRWLKTAHGVARRLT
jgi:glycosyltransferase XagB